MAARGTRTLLHALEQHAEESPDKVAWTFLDDAGRDVNRVTYAQLNAQTHALAEQLVQRQGVAPGSRALLVFVPSIEFTIALVACFRAGIIAVPVFPPDPRRLNKDLDHFATIAESSGAQVALTHGPYNYAKKVAGIKTLFSSRGTRWPELRWINVDALLSTKPAGTPAPAEALDASAVAFLQYTSGSTSDPKGVMITHGNLAHNLQLIISDLRADSSTVVVSWLPQFHDMGLIGSYLGIVYCGGSGFYMSPLSFLKSPVVWVKSMARYRATHVQAPSFAFALAARKWRAQQPVPPAGAYDLSSLRHIINAAEPVEESAVEAFAETMRPYGYDPGVMYPTYGLAEHTVFVCSGGQQRLVVVKDKLEAEGVVQQGQRGEPNTRVLMGCGFPFRGDGVDVRIVDPETRVDLGEDRVGEVWVNSPSKAVGYWGLEELSEAHFRAQLSGSAGGSFLRTGDLGFLHAEELFICGRRKDLIIVRGTNHYPQDIERTAERASASLRPGCSAAFSVTPADVHKDGSDETVILIAELQPEAEGLTSEHRTMAETIRREVAANHGLSVASVQLLRSRTIPKTTSGKVARAWCRKAFVAGGLEVVACCDFSDSIEALETERLIASDAHGEPEPEAPSQLGDAERLAPGQLEAMSDVQVLAMLEADLLRVGAAVAAPVDAAAPLATLGMDSLTLVQFKGLLENRYGCSFPDEFIFSEMATLAELVHILRRGELSDEQQAALRQGPTDTEPGRGTGPSGVPVAGTRQPPCPWCTCCM